MPVRGDIVLPSQDTATPDHEIDPVALSVAQQILLDIAVPERAKGYTPSHLAQDVGGSARSWEREFQLGNLRGFKRPGGWVTTRRYLALYIAEHQNVIEIESSLS